MNIPPMQQQGPGVIPQVPQQPGPGTPQQAQQMQPQIQQAQEKFDNISKVKSLIAPLRESLALTLKTAAQTLHQNSLVDVGSLKGVDVPVPRFDRNMEEFYSICDQIELHLKTSIECLAQGAASQRYLSLPVALTRTDPLPNQEGAALTYPQYLATVRSQVGFAKEVHDMLMGAAQNVSSGE
ncbi:mediator of RNA polymerase II transcription subunit 29 [Zootermopsis nevadensis]|uniref:Mediator of RNA polymerase II transcription subunit 29 n=1 Tax=Zootermopsis nevadensis TaxID=136037 RepID=A0A067RAP0_ZOONE|nr:mediator of RNA polymerase II transcription subunit 29 [Zootermopsis nevadensis]KDR15695.1 Mediator of RNA polymerase II transcription subunit 29 [Zootermopsis nevadensis]